MARPTRLPNGKWRIRWKDDKGIRRSEVLESKEDAEFKLKERQTLAEQIRRGLRPKSSDTLSFESLCDYWLKHRTSQKRSPKDDLSIIKSHLKPFFNRYRIKDINQEIADRYIIQKQALSPKTIHNHLTLLISMLNHAVDMERLEKAPKIRKPKASLFSTEYKYLRTIEDINKLLSASATIGDLHHDLYLCGIASGLRKGELAGLRWSDIDFDRRIITVQRSFDKPTKNGEIRYVPILDQIYSALLKRKAKSSSAFVFTFEDGRPLDSWHRIFKEDFKETIDRAGFASSTKKDGKIERCIVFHSLRHTFASHWVMNGGDIFKLQKILGHKSIQMTMRYAHLAPQAFAEDLSRFRGLSCTQEQVDNLISIGSRRTNMS